MHAPQLSNRLAQRLGACFVLTVGLISTSGCASRTAPFDSLDKAQITILRLSQPQPQPQMLPQAGGVPMIPGLTPELQQLGQQALQAMQQSGLLPPGTLPQAGGAQPGTMQPQQPMFRNQWTITDQRPVMDSDLRDKLLDLFGDEDAFNAQRGNCFTPGMAVSFQSPNHAEPLDVVVSFSCNQAMGYGFQWPHPQNGFAQDTHNELRGVYESMFGPVPQGA